MREMFLPGKSVGFYNSNNVAIDGNSALPPLEISKYAICTCRRDKQTPMTLVNMIYHPTHTPAASAHLTLRLLVFISFSAELYLKLIQ